MFSHVLLGHGENASSLRAELQEHHLQFTVHISFRHRMGVQSWQQACIPCQKGCQKPYLWLDVFDDVPNVFAGLHAHMSGSHNIEALFPAEGIVGVCASEHCA